MRLTWLLLYSFTNLGTGLTVLCQMVHHCRVSIEQNLSTTWKGINDLYSCPSYDQQRCDTPACWLVDDSWFSFPFRPITPLWLSCCSRLSDCWTAPGCSSSIEDRWKHASRLWPWQVQHTRLHPHCPLWRLDTDLCSSALHSASNLD